MSTWVGPRVDQRLRQHTVERTPMPFDHDLVGHPLLTTDTVADLAAELGAGSIVAESAVKPLVGAAPDFHQLAAGAISARIRALAEHDSWFTLLNIEHSVRYRRLVDEIVDGIAECSGLEPRALRRRMGFVFASSPHSVTPAHFDIEHSLLMQLDGHRRLGFGRFATPQDRELEVRRYWAGSYGRLEVMPVEFAEYDLAPGSGAYIPPYCPHWLHNGDAASMSLTVTFFDRSNEDESMVQSFNQKVRRFGIEPAAYGTAPVRDRVKAGLMRSYGAVRRSPQAAR